MSLESVHTFVTEKAPEIAAMPLPICCDAS